MLLLLLPPSCPGGAISSVILPTAGGNDSILAVTGGGKVVSLSTKFVFFLEAQQIEFWEVCFGCSCGKVRQSNINSIRDVAQCGRPRYSRAISAFP